MNDNVRKVFDMLGIEPYEKFKIEGNGDTIYHIDEELYIYRDNEILCSDKILKYLINGYFKIIKLPKEPKKKLRDLTKDEWDRIRGDCVERNSCDDCIFRNVICSKSSSNYSWLNNKNLYSDKFLDQEVEVEE